MDAQKKARTALRQKITRKVIVKDLTRLQKENPVLFQKWKNKEISANRAAIIMGYRTQRVSMPIDAEMIVKALKRHFNNDDLKYIAFELLQMV